MQDLSSQHSTTCCVLNRLCFKFVCPSIAPSIAWSTSYPSPHPSCLKIESGVTVHCCTSCSTDPLMQDLSSQHSTTYCVFDCVLSLCPSIAPSICLSTNQLPLASSLLFEVRIWCHGSLLHIVLYRCLHAGFELATQYYLLCIRLCFKFMSIHPSLHQFAWSTNQLPLASSLLFEVRICCHGSLLHIVLYIQIPWCRSWARITVLIV